MMEQQIIREIIISEKKSPNKKIFVGNLNPETSDDDVKLNFQRFGEITAFERKKADYALLEFKEYENAIEAVQEMDRIMIDDSQLKVNMAWVNPIKPTFQSTMNQLVQRGIVKNMASEEDCCFKCGQKGHWSVICNDVGGGSSDQTNQQPQSSFGYNQQNSYQQFNNYDRPFPGGGYSFNRRKGWIKCYGCGKMGHYKTECRVKKPGNEQNE
ncbi:peptidyl-prolyl cis-trans [Stylonychia lemnae]|uniref:Peptidyl-prolyl cis-trans n=1 Tax=Stylonychia lemnae TaxID=5949 RepID=A0A078AC51_STYLE|nr:peptidyl-prolyl cis-trans [Stylonychia lemnae]|eukprot:CDW79794.1 peptidyl-prolyl cis-trans [Stylonychia lemnae]